jgi:hypothetical protein
MLKCTVKISHVCSYMFRSNRTILRERMLSLAKVTILWNWSVKIHRYMICRVVATSISGCDVCTECPSKQNLQLAIAGVAVFRKSTEFPSDFHLHQVIAICQPSFIAWSLSTFSWQTVHTTRRITSPWRHWQTDVERRYWLAIRAPVCVCMCSLTVCCTKVARTHTNTNGCQRPRDPMTHGSAWVTFRSERVRSVGWLHPP